jgi:hypothetical protein
MHNHLIINVFINKPIFFINITIYSYYTQICLLMSTVVSLTQPVITHSSACEADAADICSLRLANPRKQVHFVYCKSKNSYFLSHYSLIHMLNPQLRIIPGKWGDGLIA